MLAGLRLSLLGVPLGNSLASLGARTSVHALLAGKVGGASHTSLRYNPVMHTRDKTSKVCPHCGVEKPADAFGFRWARSHTGARYYTLNAYCRTCSAARSRARRAADPQARQKEREYERRPEIRRRDRLRRIARTYNTTSELIESLWTGQCAICGLVFRDFLDRRWTVDHCHSSGAVRGILCVGCNRSVGQLGDTAEGVMRAVEYLRRA